MSNSADPPKKSEPDLRSRQLSEQDWVAALDALPNFLRDAHPGALITAEYGFSCRIHNDLTYVTMRIGVDWLERFLRESIDQKIFIPGQGELHIHSPDNGLSITLCHEGDIHVSGKDVNLLRKFLSTNPYNQFEFSKS